MLKIIRTSRFIKDLKRATKNHKDIKKLHKVVDTLQQTGKLPRKYKPHKLSGNWHPKWECHIESDWLLIYEINKKELALVRLGNHSDLFAI